jgi:hypothetical protein
MAIAHDATTTVGTTAASVSLSHTCTGSNLLLVAKIGIRSAASASVSDVKYGGVAMTKTDGAAASMVKVASTNEVRTEIWKLVAPATGANSVSVVLNASRVVTVSVSSYTGVDQTTPLGTAVSASGNSNAISVSVPSASTELVVDAAAQVGGGPSATLTVGASQTQRSNEKEDNAVLYLTGVGSEETGATSTAMTWSSDTIQDWAAVGVPLKAAAAAAATGSSKLLTRRGG